MKRSTVASACSIPIASGHFGSIGVGLSTVSAQTTTQADIVGSAIAHRVDSGQPPRVPTLGVIKKNVMYARYSSELQRSESCEDQERNIRHGLRKKGIDDQDFLVLNDEAESGTRSDRTCFEKLCEIIRRGEVGILAVDDQSRLSRADNASAFINDLVFHGGRFISTGEGIDTDEEGWQLRVKIMEVHNSVTIHELGRRVRRGQEGRVLDDGSAGDYPFGYESYYLDPNWAEALRLNGPKPKKGLRIYEEEARWVRQAFDWFNHGWAIREIARELTRLGIPKGHRATTTTWHQHQVRRMLSNAKYIGQWTWGKSRTLRRSDGKTRQVAVPQEEWAVRERPQLQIVELSVWDAAQCRLGKLAETFGQKPGQRRRGPKAHHKSVYPPSLLHGLVRCAECGATLWVHAGENGYLYCPNHPRGCCGMSSRAKFARVEAALLGLVTEVLTAWPPWLETALGAFQQAVKQAAAHLPESLRDDEATLHDVERRIGNLVHFLSNGAPDFQSVRAVLEDLERQKRELQTRIAAAARSLREAAVLPDEDWIRTQLADLPSLLKDDPRRVAPLLRELLGEVLAEAVIAPGKKRGFVRLRVRIGALEFVRAALGDRLPETLRSASIGDDRGDAQEFLLDLGEPTRPDRLAPEIDALRKAGVSWAEISRRTGMSEGNAYNTRKRWANAQAASREEL